MSERRRPFIAGDATVDTTPTAAPSFPLRRAVFLDRDGVLNQTIWNDREHIFDSPLRVAEVSLLPRVGEALRLLAQTGWLTVVISNQPVVAKQKTTSDELDRITETILSDVRRTGGRLDAVYYCLHHPNASLPELRAQCACRKPQPGLILQAARDLGIDTTASFMIGDRVTDARAGKAAGCRTILVTDVPSSSLPDKVDHSFRDLYHAVQWLCASASVPYALPR